jgi:hypothetical protein
MKDFKKYLEIIQETNENKNKINIDNFKEKEMVFKRDFPEKLLEKIEDEIKNFEFIGTTPIDVLLYDDNEIEIVFCKIQYLTDGSGDRHLFCYFKKGNYIFTHGEFTDGSSDNKDILTSFFKNIKNKIEMKDNEITSLIEELKNKVDINAYGY